jgi:hypothetical protein
MKKKVRKLTLSRETVCSLEDLRSTFGAGSYICTRAPYNCSINTCGGCDTGTYDDTCLYSNGCTTQCETGGTACTGLTCAC